MRCNPILRPLTNDVCDALRFYSITCHRQQNRQLGVEALRSAALKKLPTSGLRRTSNMGTRRRGQNRHPDVDALRSLTLTPSHTTSGQWTTHAVYASTNTGLIK